MDTDKHRFLLKDATHQLPPPLPQQTPQQALMDSVNTMTLRVSEIYDSIQGESSMAGMPCTLVRLAGCPLRCH